MNMNGIGSLHGIGQVSNPTPTISQNGSAWTWPMIGLGAVLVYIIWTTMMKSDY